MKTISVVTPCYDEEENVEALYRTVKEIFSEYDRYAYEHIFIDNASRDRTVSILKQLAQQDRNLKIIVNARNFGWLRSPFYGLLQGSGDATIYITADFQDPPDTIREFIRKWEEGHNVVIGLKRQSNENRLVFAVRRFYYRLLKQIAEIEHIQDFHGFGLYDRRFIDVLKNIQTPNPYFRGLVSEFGYDIAEIEYVQGRRERGKSKGSFYKMYDAAMLGFVNHSKVPLRMAIFVGFFSAAVSFFVGLVYFLYKLLYWEKFETGIAPLVVGFFFVISIQLIFIGVIGEYVGAIYTQVKNHPLVIEKERVNFD